MEKKIYEINHDVISFGPLGGKVDFVTGCLVTAMFLCYVVSLKRYSLEEKNTLAFGAKKPQADLIVKVDIDSRLMCCPSRGGPLLRRKG